MAKLDIQSSRTRAIWRSCLSSSLRTTLACAIVACTKYYGPATLSRQLAFPALSYVTTILICADATFGEALYGTVCALYGSLQGVVPAVVVLWAVGPARFTITVSTVAIALSAFLVALPESTHVIVKRVALLQIVVVYVTTFMHGTGTDPVMHPLRVGVSSGVGAIAAVAAVLLPYPHLGYLEVRKTRKLFINFSVEKLKLFVNAFCADNNASSAASISQAKSSSKACNRLLQIVKIKQTSLKWESLGFGRESSSALAADRLQALATPMNGMEMALSSCPSFPLKIVDSELKNHLRDFMNYISLRLMQLKYAYHKDSSTVYESKNDDAPYKSVLSSFRVPFPSQNDLPSFFFLFCMKLLHDECTSSPSYQVTIPGKTISMIPSKEPVVDSIEEESSIMRRILTSALKGCSRRRFLIAFRCSLSLGHSVLFGMLFSRKNGYWGGLVIASSMTPFREATYRAANTRAQGTVLGSIYGLLGCYISQRLMEVRFIVLLPWLIFSSFLTRSRMYGPAGGISAAVAAILIMGRKDYGSVTEFAIIRITETFISLTCSICVDLLLQPTRASTLARFQLSKSFNTLHSCVESLHDISELKRDLSKLKGHVNELIKFIDEAIMEPNFWFLPFAGPAYSNLSGSLSKMMELLLFGSHALEILYHESQKSSLSWMEIHGTIEGDLELFRRSLCSSIKSLEDITKMKSLEKLETDFQRKKGSNDLESRKTPNAVEYRNLCADEEEAEKIIAAFLQHSEEEILNHVADGDEEVMTRMVLWLSALGYCMDELMKEGRQLEKRMKELVQCENPASHVNLHEISCKIRELST
ncbi:uncharacterized protein [Aristolochia californica]|uniref:uncharacterized protein n=1 Tax=Aristolochia californica TaxID=171875 RepID=UPI0035DCF7D2